MPTRFSKQGDFVRKHFGAIWPEHLSAFSRLLRALRSIFDGDLDLLLILTAIAESTPAENWEPEIEGFSKLLRSSSDHSGQKAINIQSISDYPGVPRETVRRKVTILQDKGWIVRHPGGHLSVSDTAAVELEDATGHSVAYIAALFSAYDASRARKQKHAK